MSVRLFVLSLLLCSPLAILTAADATDNDAGRVESETMEEPDSPATTSRDGSTAAQPSEDEVTNDDEVVEENDKLAGDEANDTPLELDPDTAAALARDKAEAVLAARAAVSVSRGEGRALASYAWPQVGAEAGYTYIGEEPVIYSGLPQDEEEYLLAIRGEQLLWTFGRHSATRDRRQALTDSASADLALARREAAFRARIAVEAVLLAQARRAVAEDRVRQRQDELEQATLRRQAGTVTDLDVRQTETAVLVARNQVGEAAAAIRQSMAELATAIAEPIERIAVAGSLDRPVGIERLLATAREHIKTSPETAALAAGIRGQVALADEALTAYLPELYAEAEAYTVGPEWDETEEGWSAGLSLRWNLYDGGARLAQRSAALDRRRQLLRQEAGVRRERARELAQIKATTASLAERIDRQRRIVDLNAANYQDVLSQYRNGLTTLTRVGEVSLAVAENRFTLLELIYREAVAAHRLRRLIEQAVMPEAHPTAAATP